MERIEQLLRMARMAAIVALTVGCNAILDNERHSLAESTDAASGIAEGGDAPRTDDAEPSADTTLSDRTTPPDRTTPSDDAKPTDEAKPTDGASSDVRGGDAACVPDASTCQPGATGSQSVGCGDCGTKTQTRTCTASCTWGAWTDSSACNAPSVCDCSVVQYCTDPDTGGTTCMQIACTRSQALAECMVEIPNVCGATKQPFTMKYQ
jgi:hypothetical protein